MSKVQRFPDNPHLDTIEGATFSIALNYACNAKCGFCFQDFLPTGKTAVMPYEEASRRVRQAFAAGYRAVNLFGGEPTLWTGLERLTAECRDLGYTEIRLTTNAIRLADAAYTRRLAEAGLHIATLSVHGHDDATHDAVVKVPGAFQKVLKACENLDAAGVRVDFIFLLNALNHHGLSEFLDRFRGLGYTRFMLNYHLYQGNMNASADEYSVSLPVAGAAIRRAFDKLKAERVSPLPAVIDLPPCIAPEHADDLVAHRVRTTMLDAYSEVRDVQMDIIELQKSHPASCAPCRYRGRCPGVEPQYLARFGSAGLEPIR